MPGWARILAGKRSKDLNEVVRSRVRPDVELEPVGEKQRTARSDLIRRLVLRRSPRIVSGQLAARLRCAEGTTE